MAGPADSTARTRDRVAIEVEAAFLLMAAVINAAARLASTTSCEAEAAIETATTQTHEFLGGGNARMRTDGMVYRTV